MDIVKAAETVAVVLVPGLGDDIQAIKAGILEIGDVFVVNKADRDGADRVAAELAMMLDLSPPEAVAAADRPNGRAIAIRESTEVVDGSRSRTESIWPERRGSRAAAAPRPRPAPRAPRRAFPRLPS